MDLVDKNARSADSLINALRLSSCEERARKHKQEQEAAMEVDEGLAKMDAKMLFEATRRCHG